MVSDSKAGPILGPAVNTDEWLDFRRTVITATDAAAICGVSHWKTPLAVFLEKTGRAPRFDGNHYTKRGHQFEPLIAQDYSEATGVPLGRFQHIYVSRQNHYVAASPDWFRTTDNHVVETKWTSHASEDLGDDYSDVVPDEWMLQVQVQLHVMEMDSAEIAAWVGPALKLRLFTIQRNEKLIDCFLDAAAEMRTRIANDDPPEPNWEHPSTVDLVKGLYGVDGQLVSDLGEEGAFLAAEYTDFGERIKDLESRRSAVKAKILHRMGHAAIGRFPGGKEFVRHQIKATEVAYTRAAYTDLRLRKAKS